jgi:hypothetical protein
VSAKHGTRSGPQPYLSYEEEEELVTYLVKCAEIGYPKTKDEVIGIVRQALHKKKGVEFANEFRGRGWWERFMDRWPTLSLRKGDALSVSRAQALTADNLKKYYDLLKTTLETHGLMNQPSRIYNMDESGMPLDHKPPKVVAPKGMKKVHCRTSGSKGQITIIACANAAGSVILPMVIFEGKRLNSEWIKGEVPNTLYGMSERGWTDQELFFYWMTELFLEQIPPARPVMLLVDGHSSHYEPDTIKAAAEHGVVIFCLPPHCTHVAQPLDVSFFRPLKVYWSEACHTFMQENPGCVVTKYNFSKLFSKAWYKAIQPQNLIAGFSKCGICPYNSEAIKAPIYPTDSQNDDDNEDLDLDGEMAVVKSDTVGDSSGVNLNNSGENGEASCTRTSFSPEQVALFTLRYENGYDLFIDPDYVSWLLETHPEDAPAHITAEVSDPFQQFDDPTSMNDMSDFITDNFTFDLPEWYVDERVQEVTLLGDPENKDSISLSIASDVVEPSPDTPLVAVSTQPEKGSISTMATPKSPISSASDASTEVRGTPSTNPALSASFGPTVQPALTLSPICFDTIDTSRGKQGFNIYVYI